MTSEEQQALLSLRQVNETSLRKIKKKFWKALPEAGATLAELPLLQPAFPLAERDEEVTQEGEGAPECFVCCSSAPPLYRPCKCSTLVHHACLAKLCKTLPTYKSRCAVCHEPFPVRHTTAGVRFVEERANVLIMASAYGCVLAMLAFLGLAVLVCFLTGLGPAFQTRLSLATAIPALLSLVMLCILHRKHHLQTGRCGSSRPHCVAHPPLARRTFTRDAPSPGGPGASSHLGAGGGRLLSRRRRSPFWCSPTRPSRFHKRAIGNQRRSRWN